MCGCGNLGIFFFLFVIDGVIVDVFFFLSFDLNLIESILFLKDVVFFVIYGFCVVYGVVLVKIKGGKEGDLKISYDGLVVVKMVIYIFDVLGFEWYVCLSNEVVLNENLNISMFFYIDKEI